MKIWLRISEEARRKLRALMPADWPLPTDRDRPITYDLQFPTLEEIDRTMREKPRHMKRVT
jgi:hypothetical protein